MNLTIDLTLTEASSSLSDSMILIIVLANLLFTSTISVITSISFLLSGFSFYIISLISFYEIFFFSFRALSFFWWVIFDYFSFGSFFFSLLSVAFA